MSIRPMLLSLLVAMVAVAPGATQETKTASGRKAAAARPEIVLLGASVSAGFTDVTSKGKDGKVNRTYRLDVPFKKVWGHEVARIINYGDLMMFLDPVKAGARQVGLAKKRKPDLVVAVDFLFWFGYGRMARLSKKGKPHPDRLALQAKGLAQLESLGIPLVIGDYPDYRGASSHMLPSRMIPNPVTLATLNSRLYAWAAKRANVHVFPIAGFVKEAVTVEQCYPWDEKQRVVLPKNFLLQSDRLHANRVGTLVIALRVAEFLPRILRTGHPLLKARPTFRSLVEAAGLEADLPVLQPVPKPAPRPGGATTVDRGPGNGNGGTKPRTKQGNGG